MFSFIIIENKFFDLFIGVEKLIIIDGKNIECIEVLDILIFFKLFGLIKYGFNINEWYIKLLSYVL